MVGKFLYFSLFLFFVATQYLQGQPVATHPLFQSTELLHIRADTKIKYIKKNLNDSTYHSRKIYYENNGRWDSMNVDVRLRGHFRLENCRIPPIKFKLKKSATKGTLFEGVKELKLVVPCQKTSGMDAAIVKEYICYQLYRKISPYYFNARLLNMDITDYSRKKPEKSSHAAFFIEDIENVTERMALQTVNDKTIFPARLDATSALATDYFEYMIGNIDWSAVYQHNIKVVRNTKGTYIPIPYDFDMSGFVNAYYNQSSPDAGPASERGRVYRGFCRDESSMRAVRDKFLALEPEFDAVVDTYAEHFNGSEIQEMKGYLDGFYEILKDDSKFQESILKGCRTK